MGSFLRAFYILMFAVPAMLLLAGVPGSSTREEVKEEVVSRESTLVQNLWRVPKYGFTLRLPESWAWMSTGNRESVSLDPNRRDRGTINAISLPNFFGKSLFQLEHENMEALRTTPGIEFDESRRIVQDGVDVLRFDYHGRQLGLDVDMRYVCFVWLANGQQVILTVQLEASRWPELGPALEDALGTLRFGV
ncbi:MAG: hypothetical protein L6Q99_09770 [Planctomycetes bacterium]|nr:hypothetical protein [Planctomycetota bacterium]